MGTMVTVVTIWDKGARVSVPRRVQKERAHCASAN